MNWDRVESDWRQHKGSFKRQWNKLTNIDVFTGERSRLARHIQDRYGVSAYEAERQLADWQGREKEADIPAVTRAPVSIR